MADAQVLRERTSIVKIAEYHNDVIDSLKFYFSQDLEHFSLRFLGQSREEIDDALSERIEETDIRSSLAVLVSVEAAFRVDFEYRCRKRLKDKVSRSFRALNKVKKRVSLDEDIFQAWSGSSTEARGIHSFTAIPSVFILRYRWLRSKPSTSAVRVTLPWFSSSFLRM